MTENASHFEDQAWIGFALRLLPDHQSAKMRAHLDDGCASCIYARELWRMVAEFAVREPRYEPPRDLVDAVKAAFPLARIMSVLPSIARSAQMRFDSSREPLPDGLRGGSPAARHLVYETEDFLIGLLLEREVEKRRIALTGQVVPRGLAERSAVKVKVLVTGDRGRPMRHTGVNSLGEFQVELDEQKHLTLYLQLSDSDIASIVLMPPAN